MNDINYLVFIFVVFISIFFVNSYIIIPFQEIRKDETNDFRDVDDFINEVSYLNLYSDFYLGSTSFKLPVLLKSNIDYFALTKNDEEQLKSPENYNPSSSESFKIIESNNKIISENKLYSYASETFHFLMSEGEMSSIYSDKGFGEINAINYYSYNNINFLYSKTKKESHYCGILGFSYYNLENENVNFIYELYQKSLIDSTVWSVDFPDIDEETFKKGNIIIGELPHIYAPQYYKENQYFTTTMPKDDINNKDNRSWKIKIDSATIIRQYYENTHKKQYGTSIGYLKTISIDFGVYMMYAPMDLFEQLKDIYLNSLFDSGICDYKKIKHDDNKILVVFCDKKLYDKNEQMNFPTIYFDIQSLGGNFELNYKDLFMTKNDKVFLLIAFSSKEITDTIKLGQIFLYKYKFTFDYGKNEIGFYRNDLSSQKVVHRIKRAFRGKSVLIFLLLVIIGLGIYLCYKKGFLIRKKIFDYNAANKNISHFKGKDLEQGYELKTDN